MDRIRILLTENWPTVLRCTFLYLKSITLVILLIFMSTGYAVDLMQNEAVIEELNDEEIEAWFNDSPEEKALQVNEGDLVFLEEPPRHTLHHIHNTLIIDEKSLASGWVRLVQCHEHLDAVPDTQIVYRYKEIENLRIESHSGISKAWVEGSSIQLTDIGKNARVCVKAEVRIFKSTREGTYILRNGPFHRKFLDGYYPMQVTLNIRYPSDRISFESIKPVLQRGFTLNMASDELTVNAFFEGMLITEIRFTTKKHREE